LKGVKETPVGEGTHLLIPFLQRAILYDCRVKPRTISTTTGSKDLQMVTLSLRVLSRPDFDKLAEIYRTLGLDYDERILPSIGNEVLKATVAGYDAAELIVRCLFCRFLSAMTLGPDPARGRVVPDKGGPPEAREGVQPHARGRLHHPFDLRAGLHPGRRGKASCTAGGRAGQVRG
jgi:hypothetical protein